MSGGMGQFAADTLVATGLLIVLVMALRGPVARWFGPQVAYGLWALPLLRLFLPPLTLPASMAPRAPDALAAVPMGVARISADGGAALAPMPADLSLTHVLAAVWLAGALALLGWRAQQYRAMRRQILHLARPVGEVGRVRLVETPACAQPLAFGIVDKVVALPVGFMSQRDRGLRDLAIAHELAHHRGHDLAANLAAQLLLAVHWFNPLAWVGWRAMRKDQEAACDARVVAGRGRAERAAYAEVIAGFAAGSRLSRSAPLACQMLGEKSIIHRLRRLSLSEIPQARRRIGLGAIVAGGLALPLTASISYAQPEAPRIERRIVIVDAPEGAEMDDPALHSQTVERADGTTVVLRTSQPVSPEEARERVEIAIATMPEPPAPPAPPSPPAPPEAEAVPVPPASTSRHRFAMIDRENGQNIEITTTCEGGEVACRAQVRTLARAEAAAERGASAQAIAIEALQGAREAVARAPMPEAARAEALREIDREIASMREGHASSMAKPRLAPAPQAMRSASLRTLAPKAMLPVLRMTLKPAAGHRIVTARKSDCPEPERFAGRIA